MLCEYHRIELKFSSILLAIAIFFLLPDNIVSAAETGRVDLDGRQIILFDDNTWKYSPSSENTGTSNDESASTSNDESECVRLNSKVLPISICLDESIWVLGDGGSGELSFNTKDEKLYLMMITETDEIPLKNFEKAIFTNAQNAAGLKPVEVIVKERLDIHGRKWGRMVYVANVNGMIIKYENIFTAIKNKGSVQFVFYTLPNDYQKMLVEIEKAKNKIVVQ